MHVKERLIKHTAICFGIVFVFSLLIIFSSKVSIGFVGHFALLIFGTIFTTIGVALGDAFRRFVRPDAYFVDGAVDAFRKKLFWMYGPQCIGWFIGFMATKGFMQNIVGIRGF